MSKGSSPRRLVVRWDPDRQLWMRVPPQEGFFELPEPYSETWPASGSMRNGTCVPPPTTAPPTAAGGSSSSPGLPTPRAQDSKGKGLPDGLPNVVTLLKTPTAQLAINGGSQHPDKRKAGGHGPTLADEVEHLLPTPTRSDATNTANFRPDGTPYSSGYGMTLTDATRLLPTPRASDGEKGGPGQRGSSGDLMLPSAVAHLLPTPTAADSDRSSSTYMRGNPTLRGACTSPPSGAGKPPSADRRPGQLTFGDGSAPSSSNG